MFWRGFRVIGLIVGLVTITGFDLMPDWGEVVLVEFEEVRDGFWDVWFLIAVWGVFYVYESAEAREFVLGDVLLTKFYT